MEKVATISIRMEQDKETKGTYRYATQEEGAVVRTVYISKLAFPDGAPKSIEVTISEG